MFEFRYKLTFDDYKIFLKASRKRQKRKKGQNRTILLIVLFAILAITLIPTLLTDPAQFIEGDFLLRMGLIGVVFLLAMKFFVPWLWRKRFETEQIGLNTIEVRADPEKLHILQKGAETAIDWSRVEDFTQGAAHMFLWLGPVHSVIIPRSAFASPEQTDAFSEFVLTRINGA